MQTIEFQFSIGQSVVIELTSQSATVDALFISEDGPKQARVEYVDGEGVIRSAYFLESKLSLPSTK